MDIKGVIFDMDGLILDTEVLYQKFWRQASANCGYNMSAEQVLQLRSLDKTLAKKLLQSFFGEDFDYQKVHDERVRIMADYIEKNGVQAKKGVAEFTSYLKQNGYKTAVATATNYKRANKHLTMAGVRDCFENIICATDVEHGKPYPDVYLYACEKIGLQPCECLALEDSPNGIRSASGAGCTVICIPDTAKPDKETEKLTYAVVNSLCDVVQVLEKIKKG
ncbi:MAG: HAD family phosphatase [Lachnospiraceae bacterium]|nr:HAD family phosphatase [Lachnospiraceae bacterium]